MVFSEAKVELETTRSVFCNDEELANFFIESDDNFPKELNERDFVDKENVLEDALLVEEPCL